MYKIHLGFISKTVSKISLALVYFPFERTYIIHQTGKKINQFAIGKFF